MDQRLSGSRYSCSTGAHRAAAASLEHREQICWSTRSSVFDIYGSRYSSSMCSSGAAVAAARDPLMHVLQLNCSLCSRGAGVCAP